MPPEGKESSLPPRHKHYRDRGVLSPLTGSTPTRRLSIHSAESPPPYPPYDAQYPDPNEKWAPKRRESDDGKNIPLILGEQDRRQRIASALPTTLQAPRLQKSDTMPPGYIPQLQARISAPPRVPLNRAYTMQPEHEYNRPAEKHRSAKKRSSFDDEFPEYYQTPIQTRYHVNSREGTPRTISAAPGTPFSKVKTGSSYGAEEFSRRNSIFPSDVETSRLYGEDYRGSGFQNDEEVLYQRARSPRERRTTITIDHPSTESDISDGSDSDDSSDIFTPDKSRTPATSLLSPSDSGLSASHEGVSRGRQFYRPLNARRLAGVANRNTISKDNTTGDEAREEKLLAHMGRKICRTPQQAKKLQAGNGERWNRDRRVRMTAPSPVQP